MNGARGELPPRGVPLVTLRLSEHKAAQAAVAADRHVEPH